MLDLETIKENRGLTDILLAIEHMLDTNHIYAYRGWEEAYVSEGPTITRFWIELVFEFEQNEIVDPAGAKLIEKLGGVVVPFKVKRLTSVDVKSEEDFEPGTKYPKKETTEHLAFRVKLPRTYLDSFYVGRPSELRDPLSPADTDSEMDDAKIVRDAMNQGVE